MRARVPFPRRLMLCVPLWLVAATALADIHLSPTSVTLAENAGPATVTLVRTGSKPREWLRYSTVAGTATSGVDYTAASGVCIALTPGTANLAIHVPVSNDGSAEPNETFEVTLAAVAAGACGPGTHATSSTISAGTATVTILDNDTPDVVQIDTPSVAIAETATPAQVTLTRTGTGIGAISVTVATSNGTASAGSDFTALNTTVNWVDGDTAPKTVNVAILNDTTVEGGESFTVALSNPSSGATLGLTTSATVTLTDNDVDVPSVVGQTQANAGTSLATAGLVTGSVSATQSTTVAIGTVLTQNPAAGADIDPGLTPNVDLSVSDGTRVPDVTGHTQANATAALTAAGLVVGTVSNAPSATIPTGSVISQSPVADANTPVEPGSAVDLVISGGGATIAIAGSVNVAETSATATVTVTRSGNLAGAVSVEISTSNGSATAGQDYTALPATTISWVGGDGAAKTVDIALLNDPVIEGSESFTVALANVSGTATLGTPNTATVTITDNDVDVPNVVGQTQANAGITLSGAGLGTGAITATQSATVAIGTVLTQNPAAGTDVDPGLTPNVDLSVSDGTRVPDVTGQTQANAAATLTTAGLVVGTVSNAPSATVPAGSVISQWPVADANTPVEPGTAVDLVVSGGGAVLAFAGDVNVVENTATATLSVTRSGNSSGAVSVEVTTSDGSASAGQDYSAVSTTLNWADGDSATKSVNVTLLNDANVEGSESFTATLGTVGGSATLGAPNTATVTLTDNDVDVPSVVGQTQANAGTTLAGAGLGTGAITATQSTTVAIGTVLTQNPAAGNDVDPGLTPNVDLSVSDGSRVPDVTGQTQANATATLNTAGLVVGTVSNAPSAIVPAGSVISQSPVADANTPVEPGTAVDLAVSSGPTPNSILALSGDVAVNESAVSATLTITRTNGSAGAVSVDVVTSDGSAHAGSDYTALSTTLAWADGDSTAKTVIVAILDDGTAESGESFTVTLANPSTGATLGAPASAAVTIADDDAATTVAFATAAVGVVESAATVVVNITRTGSSAGAVSVDYSTAAGSAQAGSDFVAAAGTVSWADGDAAAKPVTVQVVNDALQESPSIERFTLALANANGATLGSPSAVEIDVTDDDVPAPVTDLAGPDQTVVSGASDTAPVTLPASSNQFASYEWSLGGGVIATGVNPTVTLPVGVHDIQLTARDGAGTPTIDFVRITVVHRELPDIELAALPGLDPTERSVARALDDLCPRLNAAASLTPDQNDLRERCTQLMLHDDAAAQVAAIDQISGRPVTAMMTNLLEISVLQERNLASRIRALRQGDRGLSVSGLALTVDGKPIPDAALQELVDAVGGGAGDERSRLGFFVMGNVFLGEQDETGRETGFDFDTAGITAGVDYRLSERVFAGAALGFSSGDADFNGRPGNLETETATASVFGSYYAGALYVDLVAAHTWSAQDESRFVGYSDASGSVARTARGSADGVMRTLGSELGWMLGAAAWRLNPRVGAFYADATIERFRERGAAGLDLLFDEQNADSLTISAGGSASYTLRTDSALWTPELRFDAVRELQRGGQALRAAFANDPFAPRSGVDPTPSIRLFADEFDEDYFSLGIGLSVQMRNRISIVLDWQTVADREDVSANSQSASVRIERSF